MRRFRPAISVLLFVVVAFALPLGVLTAWAQDTVYNSDTFSRRAVQLLDSPVAQQQLASQITDQLAQAGYRPAVEFRPAFQFAVQVAIGTDAFRAIFRDAVAHFHAALLANNKTGNGLNLADALTVITSTVSLPGSAQGGGGGNSGLARSLQNVTTRASDLKLWSWDDLMEAIALISLSVAVVCAVAAIVIAIDRRSAVMRLGLAVAVGGGVLLLLRLFGLLAIRRTIGDPGLANAIEAGVAHATNDLKVIGLGLLSYGAVIAAAVAPFSLEPRDLAVRLRDWGARLQRRKRAWVVPALVLIFLGVSVAGDTEAASDTMLFLFGLWLVYLGVHRLVAHIRVRATEGADAVVRAHERRRLILAATAVVVVLALVTTGFVVATRRASAAAQATSARECNGSADFCDAPLDEVVFPGTHNSMSSSLYPGWLFGEQIATIKGQLESGVRALLIDTHYGEATNVRIPGADVPLVVTDRAAELSAPPGGEDDANLDPELQQRALALAARQAPSSQAKRAIYLCHNYCELGAVLFSSAMTEVKNFLDTHPDQVVILDIQDATTPADTAAVLEATGLADYAATLGQNQPLPTLGDLIDQGKRLLVFAEQNGAGAPPWYMSTYNWFQETAYSFTSQDLFNCRPNRGYGTNPLFLLNHWVSESPPDPAAAAKANSSAVLGTRIATCVDQRRHLPNIVAVDFSTRGQLVQEVKALNTAYGKYRKEVADAERHSSSTSSPSTTAAAASASTAAPALPSGLPAPVQTPVTTLTGGDPTAFSAAYNDEFLIFTDYSIAGLSDGNEFQGQADLAYAPLLQSTIASYIAVAPQELASLAVPLQQRMQAAVDVLRSLGVTPALLQRLADSTKGSFVAGVDPLSIEHENIKQLEADIGTDRLAQAAQSFRASQGDPSTAVDLGAVTNDAAATAGFTCLAS